MGIGMRKLRKDEEEEEGETVCSLRHKCQVSSDPASSKSLANLQFANKSPLLGQSSQKRETLTVSD